MLPFRGSNHAFDPATLDILQQAFDSAWIELLTAGSALATGTSRERTRETLAKRILASATAGVREVETLKSEALHDLL